MNLTPEDDVPNFLGLKQDMEKAFTQGGDYTLCDFEVETVYLCLCRLQAIEEMAAKGDWEGMKIYLPEPDSEPS